MEWMQVEITSVETIKPSTPTPPHLKSYTFCLLDQLFPLIYVPQVLFYNNPAHDDNSLSKNDPNQHILTCLKDSLSKSLSLFYPLAGRLTQDESSIDCNDKGVPFIEARAKGTLHAFLKDPNRIKSLPYYIPHDIYDHPSQSRSGSRGSTTTCGQPLKVTHLLPLVLQVTVFDCGGFAIGYQKLHKIVDGASWGSFLETWAALAAGHNEGVVTPDFSTALSLFPPCDWAMTTPGTRSIILNPFDIKEGYGERCIVKVFGFSAPAIATLQADQARSKHVPNPTRVEAVSGFIWKYAMAAATTARANSKMQAPSVLIHTVNMRPCSRPKLPPAAIGNLITHAVAYFKDIKNTSPAKLELKDLVVEIRRCISEAKDDKFLSKFQGKEGGNFVREQMKKMMNIYEDTNINPYKFTSWSRNGLGLNSDFGFGIPVWIAYIGGRVNPLLRNFIALIGTIDNGIEAWLGLDEIEMGILKSDSQFLAFASPVN